MAPLRKRGRPPLDAKGAASVAVQIRLTPGQYDSVWQRAHTSRRTVSALIRCVLDATDPANSVKQKSPR